MEDWVAAVIEVIWAATMLSCIASILYDVLPTKEPEWTSGEVPYPEYEKEES